MALDLEIKSLLQTNQVKEINFSMRGLRITGYGYLELSNYFSDQPVNNRIRVSVRPQLVTPGFDAEYIPAEDKMLFRSADVLATPFGRALAVHECTHAQLDLRARSSSQRSEEAACLIAQAWYLLASGVNVHLIDQRLTSQIRGIASGLRRQAHTQFGNPVEISQEFLTVARDIANRQFGYANHTYVSNGIGGSRYRGD